MEDQKLRPTKKQRQLLDFITSFIDEHGYSPSYREIRDGVGYTSIATVALHVNNLVARGHLQKRDNAARSLEVVTQSDTPPKLHTNEIKPAEEKWLIEKIEYLIHQAEDATTIDKTRLDELYILLEALRILGLDGAAQSFTPRLAKIRDSL